MRRHTLGERRYFAPEHFTPGLVRETIVAVAEVTAVWLVVLMLLLVGDGPLLELLRGLLPLLQKVLQLLLLARELVLQLLELSLELCFRHVLPRVLRVVLEPAARGRR